MDADLVLFDPDQRSTVDTSELLQRHPTTPYAGRTLDGRVVTTYVRGMEVFANGRISDVRVGTLLSKGAA
jgi:allantoinase